MIISHRCEAQENYPTHEKFGNTLNLSGGIGYYGYIGHPLPVVLVNYEIDIARNFTLAPFVGFYTYTDYYYWGDPGMPEPDYRYYSYRETVVPVGVKGTYYFDELFRANENWDFYAAASVGATFRKRVWEDRYYGNQRIRTGASPVYLDAHIGAERHISKKVGVFLDLSTGVSSLGFGFHF